MGHSASLLLVTNDPKMHKFETIIHVSHGFVRLLAAAGWFSLGVSHSYSGWTSLKSQWTGHQESHSLTGIDVGHWLELS